MSHAIKGLSDSKYAQQTVVTNHWLGILNGGLSIVTLHMRSISRIIVQIFLISEKETFLKDALKKCLIIYITRTDIILAHAKGGTSL